MVKGLLGSIRSNRQRSVVLLTKSIDQERESGVEAQVEVRSIPILRSGQ